MKNLLAISSAIVLSIGCAANQAMSSASLARENYPAHWFVEIDRTTAASWEILPQDAKSGEVILSKRNELGLLSNFAATPFEYRGKKYASLEGFWQSMLFPESKDDPRAKSKLEYPNTRAEVEQMTAFDAKRAGEKAKANMKAMGIEWVSFEGQRFIYRSKTPGEHYRLIWEATLAKVEQNKNVRDVLIATGDLKLMPDHHQDADSPPEWRYYELYEKIRTTLKGTH